MADGNEVKITSEAIKALREELAKLTLQFRATNDLVKYKDGVIAIRDGLVVAKAGATNLQSTLLLLDNAANKSAGQLRGGIGRSLDDINIKLGNTRPLVTSMSQAMQDSAQFSMGAAQGIRAVANNIEMMVQQMTYLKSQGMSVGQIFTSMRSTIMGPIGILLAFSAFSAVIQWVTTALQQSGKAAKETKNEYVDLIDEIAKLKVDIGGAKEERIQDLMRRQIVFGSRYSELKGGDRVISPRAMGRIAQGGRPLTEAEKTEALVLQRALLTIQKELNQYSKEDTDEAKKKTAELEKQEKLRKKAILDWFDEQGRMTNLAFEDKAMSSRPIAGLVDKQKGWIGKEKIDYFGFRDAEKDAFNFTKELTRGLEGATDALARGFTNSFSLGQTLLGQFAASIMAVLAEIAAKRLILGLLDILGLGMAATPFISGPTALWGGTKTITARASGGWLNEPIVGMGMKSRSMYTLAENGPEYVSPASSNRMGQQGRGGGAMQPVFVIRNEITAGKFATFVEGGNRTNKRIRVR